MKKRKVVLAGGCFDILHPGHIEFLQKAKRLGDTLIILLESDENVKNLKGEKRPINNLKIRTENLFTTGCVNIVVPLDSEVSDNYYEKIVNSISPDIIAITKGDPLTEVKTKQAKMAGGKVEIIMERNPKHSTTLLIKK